MSAEESTGEQVLSGIGALGFVIMLCTLALCLTIHHSKGEVTVVYEVAGYELEKKG